MAIKILPNFLWIILRKRGKEMNSYVNAANFVGDDYLVTIEKCILLYNHLKKMLYQHEQITIDFEGCSEMYTPFMVQTFGILAVDLGSVDVYKKRVKAINLNDMAPMYYRVIERAIEFSAMSEERKREVEEILKEHRNE